MKNQIAIAVIALFAAASAYAGQSSNGQQNTINGSFNGAGEITVGGSTDTGEAYSTTSGQAVSGTEISGNGFSAQSTQSIGAGTSSAGAVFSPTGVTATSGQTSTSNVVSKSVSNTPGVAGIVTTPAQAGVAATTTIDNGTIGFSDVSNNSASQATFNEEAIGATVAISGVGSVGQTVTNSGSGNGNQGGYNGGW